MIRLPAENELVDACRSIAFHSAGCSRRNDNHRIMVFGSSAITTLLIASYAVDAPQLPLENEIAPANTFSGARNNFIKIQ